MKRVGTRDHAFAFFRDRLGFTFSEDFRGGLYVKDQYIGAPMEMDHVGIALGYSGFNCRTCMISVVIQDKTMVTRQVLEDTFQYPFIVCGVQVLFALVDSTNKESIELCERVGFERVATFANAGLHGDLVQFTMTRNQCRWIRNGKVKSPATS